MRGKSCTEVINGLLTPRFDPFEKKMKAREADTIDLEDVSVSQANEIKNKSYEDIRIY